MPIEEALQLALDRTAGALEARPDPILERTLEDELLAQLSGVLAEAELGTADNQGPMTLAGWPGVGDCDLEIRTPGDRNAAALVELKWGAGTLYNCVWDFAKLGLALREGTANSAYPIAGAPLNDWHSDKPGVGLFRSARWDTVAFMDFYRELFAFWRTEVKTRPERLPDEITAQPAARVGLNVGSGKWELRCSRVTAPQAGLVSIDADGVATTQATGEQAERLSLSSLEEIPGDDQPLTRLRSFEGGSAYLAGERSLVIDEGTMADFVPPDEVGETALQHLLRFRSTPDRDAYIKDRGWLESRNPGVPLALRIESKSPQEEQSVSWDGVSLRLRSEGSRGHSDQRQPMSSDPARWAPLVELANQLDVWNWHRWYRPEVFSTDGQFWSFLLAVDGHFVQSRGYNAFPPRGSADDAAFKELLSAALRLAGGGEAIPD